MSILASVASCDVVLKSFQSPMKEGGCTMWPPGTPSPGKPSVIQVRSFVASLHCLLRILSCIYHDLNVLLVIVSLLSPWHVRMKPRVFSVLSTAWDTWYTLQERFEK